MTNLSNIVEILAKQALGGNQQQSRQGGLGDILASVFGQMSANDTQQSQQQNQQNQQRQSGGLGGILGSVLGHLSGQQNQQQNQQPQYNQQ